MTAPRVFTADEVEAFLLAALKAADMEGVDAALRVMVTIDPARAKVLYDTMKVALELRGRS